MYHFYFKAKNAEDKGKKLAAEEARAKGLKNYVVVSEGRPGAIPEEWKDKDIKWSGGYVSEITPTLSDQQNPDRMTYDGEVYRRE